MASCFRVSKASIGQNQLQPTLEMVRVLLLTACATVAAAQFNIKHTQYGTSPPVYPSPRTCGAGGWDAALEKAQAFVADLTTEEKAQIITGQAGQMVYTTASTTPYSLVICTVSLSALFTEHAMNAALT
jgi:hypothetical protein